MLFVGTDVGGTFTDVVIFDEESRKSPEVIKVPTDLKHPESAILQALEQYEDRAEQFALVSHATTIATNSLLTQSGLATTALITNEGFRDVLEIGRQRRPEIYNLNTERPKQLVQGKDRFTVKGRRLVNGSRLAPLAEKDLLKVSAEIISRGIESVAISFLNSYINPADEIRAEEILRRSGFKGHVDLSSRIDPQYREYERTSTTVVNASLAPSISRYLQRLKKELEQIGIESPLYVMNSDGTASTTAQASKHPISIIESGPAAGVLSSRNLAEHLSLTKAITFDMGGTTAKAGTIVSGMPDLAYEFEAAGRTYHGRSIKGSGYPVRQPFIDLAEVSAGGGTIAHLDETGSLKVGPESAGADPGPAAYGKGGKRATVTDANIIAGRINASQLLGGHLKLHDDLALRSISELSRRLAESTNEVAENILRMVNNNMSRALRLVSVERGRDPREYTLIAFGGAGPLHACDLAGELGIRRIVIPVHPGLFSAFGLLTSEISRTFVLPILRPAAVSIGSTNVLDISDVRRPKAEKRPGCTGMTILLIPSSPARSHACNGPAPPKAMSVYSLGSRPRSTLTSLRALLMLLLTIRRMFSATSLVDSASLRLSSLILLSARSSCSLRWPPSNWEALILPAIIFASVTVARFPPFP